MSDTVYLLTGAAGFMGGTICRKLIERGDKVRALVLPGDKAISFVPKEAEIVEGDLCDDEALTRFFTVADDCEIVVIHVASIVTVNPEYNQKVMDVNVGGTKNIIRHCQNSRQFKKLVYVSSTGCIPELPKGRLIDEVNFFTDEGLKDCYSQSKALATQAVLDAAEAGLNACVVHPTGIMGPEDFAIGHTTKVLAQIINGEMSAAIAGSFNLADVRDLADGTIAAADKGRKGECYILGNDAVSFKDFTRLVVKESGCKPVKFFLPGKFAYKLAAKMEKKAKKTGKMPQMTTFAVWNLMRNNDFDSSKARKELGYRTRSYQETMHDQIKWMKGAGIIHVPERKFRVICEEGHIENNKIIITSAQRGVLKIDDTHLIFKPIYLNFGDHSPRTYEVADVKSVKRGPLTHLYIYLTDNRVIRLNTTSKKAIINILSK